MNQGVKRTHSRTFLSDALKSSLFIGVILALLGFAGCRPSRVLLHPVPAEIDRIEGHASLRISNEQDSTRSKFTFLFQLPQQGRIEVSDALLGRTLYQIIMDCERAVFVLPSKKVYWEGEEEEIISTFLGFRLNLDEMVSLLRGEWAGDEGEQEGGKNAERWILKKDEAGRIAAGKRGNLSFEVKEFLSNSGLPRILLFQHPLNSGRLKILRIDFNRPVKKKNAFSFDFLARYRRVSWEEMEKILTDEY
ncbi:MAG: lipoprotein insertase outer membrane protein LolB [Candidatus Aminicenantes bacterium]